MIIDYNGKKYLELPVEVGDIVYICTTVDWDLGIVQGVVTGLEADWSDKFQEFYWRIYVEHDYIHGTNNPVLIVNRYIFCEKEVAKTKEEANKKLQDQIIQKEARRIVNRGVNV